MITENEKEVYNFLRQIQNYDGDQIDSNRITITDKWPESIFDLVFLLGEDQDMKDTLIQKLENEQSEKCIIAVSCDSIPLGDIQKRAIRPQQIIGVNWCVPAHTTFFLEIVKSPITEDQVSKKIKSLAVSYWQKDPYIIEGQLGIRSKLLAALIREAFHIVEEGYASAKDVD
ncbi:MAG: hypothetical protein HKN76_03665, partial [Saprospiraceae bacterium]|nr:hypothetical protein [Saprospiraceae bacterium]